MAEKDLSGLEKQLCDRTDYKEIVKAKMGMEPYWSEKFDYILNNRYLYPFLASLIISGSNEPLTENWTGQQHRVKLDKMLNDDKSVFSFTDKLPELECLFGFSYYFAKTNEAIESYRNAHSEKIPVASEVVIPTVEHFNIKRKDSSVWDVKIDVDKAYKKEDTQRIYDVTDILNGHDSSKIKNKNMRTAMEDGKRIYSFYGPRVDKWVLENGKWATNADNQPKLDLNDQLKMLSVLCAPYKDRLSGETYDLRFIADSEIFDITAKKDENGRVSVRDQNGNAKITFETETRGDIGHYGLSKNLVARVRENIYSELDSEHAVYFMTASEKDAKTAISLFIKMYNELIDNGLKSLLPKDGILEHKGTNEDDFEFREDFDVTSDMYDVVNAVIPCQKSEVGRKDSWIFYEPDRCIQKLRHVSNNSGKRMHDKIPYSFVGSLIKDDRIDEIHEWIDNRFNDMINNKLKFQIPDWLCRKPFKKMALEEYQDKAKEIMNEIETVYSKVPQACSRPNKENAII